MEVVEIESHTETSLGTPLSLLVGSPMLSNFLWYIQRWTISISSQFSLKRYLLKITAQYAVVNSTPRSFSSHKEIKQKILIKI